MPGANNRCRCFRRQDKCERPRQPRSESLACRAPSPLIGHTHSSGAAKLSLCWQTLAKTVGPNYPRYVYNEASFPTHKLGSRVSSVTVHEDKAHLFFVCSGELITSDFIRDSSDLRLKAT